MFSDAAAQGDCRAAASEAEMVRLAELANRELHWVESAGGSWAYDLRSGAEQIGHMRFETESGSRARAELDGRTWFFERNESLGMSVAVHAEGSPEPYATFTQRWTGGGIVKFRSGVQYCWNSSHIWSTTYCFRRKGQKPSVCVSQEVPSRRGSRVTVCADAIAMPETPVLILLGWFLEILVFERLAETSISW
jgi:hypothetical protein